MFKENIEAIKALIDSRSEEAFRDGLRKTWDAKVAETIPLIITREEWFELGRFIRYGDKENQLAMFNRARDLGWFGSEE